MSSKINIIESVRVFDSWVKQSQTAGRLTNHNASKIKKIFKNIVSAHPVEKKALSIFNKKIDGIKKKFRKKTTTSYIKKAALNALKNNHLKTDPKAKVAQTTLYTAEIRNPRILKTVKKIVASWKQKAKKNNTSIQKSTTLSEDKKLLSKDLVLALAILKDKLSMQRKTHTTYVAYDKNKIIQGIAIKCLSHKRGTKLSLLCSNPKNVVIRGNEKVVRGAGTALIKHLVHEIKEKKQKKPFYLESLTSALPFYKKLGFTGHQIPGQPHLYDLSFPKTKIDTLLKSYKDVGHIQKKEPTHLH